MHSLGTYLRSVLIKLSQINGCMLYAVGWSICSVNITDNATEMQQMLTLISALCCH